MCKILFLASLILASVAQAAPLLPNQNPVESQTQKVFWGEDNLKGAIVFLGEDTLKNKVYEGLYPGANEVLGIKQQALTGAELNHLSAPFSNYTINIVSALESIDVSIVESQTSNPDAPVVLFMQGNAWRVREMLNGISEVKDDDTGDYLKVDIVTQLLKMGYRVAMFDYPGFGSSSGRASEKALTDTTQAVVRSLYGENKKPIFIVGHSLGGTVALEAVSQMTSAEQKQMIRGLVSISAFNDLVAETQAQPGFLAQTFSAIAPQVIAKMEDKYLVAQGASRIAIPTLIMHAGNDETTPVPMAPQIYVQIKRLNKEAEMNVISDVTHDEILDAGHAGFLKIWNEIGNYIKAH
jgi:alpha-beta hydrolase superfamily lysophospholipase